MQLVVLADESLKKELLSNGKRDEADVEWIESPDQFSISKKADVCCDLLFDGSPGRIEALKNISQTVIINSVVKTLADVEPSFIRINGWPGFLKNATTEANCGDEYKMEHAEIFFSAFNKKVEWTPDEPGFISARIVAMIINEAYLALGEGVSTKSEIDIAMKLGTNYPYGPFEWAEMIGIKNIYSLLGELSKTNSRYQPAMLLEKEATN